MRKPDGELQRLLNPARARLLLQAAVRTGWYGLFGGLCAAGAAVIVSFLTPVEGLPLIVAACVAFAPLAGAAAGVVFLRPSWEQAAKALDRLGGQERAATLLELEGREDAYTSLLRQDAGRALPVIDVKAGIGLGQRRWMYLACSAIALSVLVSFAIPNGQRDIVNMRHETKRAIQKQAEKIEKAMDDPALDEATKAELRKLAGELREARTMSDALKQLSKAEDNIKELARQQASQAANQLAASFEGGSKTKPLAEALKKLDSKAFEKLADDLAGDLKDGKLSAADKSALQQALSQAAGSISDKELSASLDAAAEAMKSQADSQAADALAAALSSAGKASGGQSGDAVDANALLKAARAQLSAAGASLSNKQGSDGNGNGNGSGNGSGNGNGNGNGNENGSGSGNGSGTGSGAGAGTGGGPDSENESANGYGKGGNNSQFTPGGEKQQGTYEPVYAPDRLGGSDSGVTPGGQRNGDGQSDMLNMGPGQGTAGDYIPYDQIVYEYQAQAAEAMDRESIPAGLRQWVERYFSSITN